MKKAYVDSCVWITKIEGMKEYQTVINEHLLILKKEGWIFCISEMVLLEILCKPIIQSNSALRKSYIHLIKNTDKIEGYKYILTLALTKVHTEKLKVIDAIHVSFAEHDSCDRFVTTDFDFSNLKSVEPYIIPLPTIPHVN